MKKLSTIPTMNFPKKSGTYNIIQFYIEEKPYLRFGRNLDMKKYPDSYEGSHQQIISHFCEEADSNAQTVERVGNGRASPINVPVLPSTPTDSIDCILVGAGTCKLDLRPDALRHFTDFPVEFYGNSIAYNRMICSYHLIQMKDEFKANGISIEINDIRYDLDK